MKWELFNHMVVTEPDRQRLARFAIAAVDTLGGNLFSAAVAIEQALHDLQSQLGTEPQLQNVALRVDDQVLTLAWADQYAILGNLPALPTEVVLAELSQYYKQASEHADPELLRLQNRKITEELEKAAQRAAQEMARLEANLEKKKSELLDSIKAAETDSLTGLFNRGGYDLRLQQAVMRCHRQSEALNLILLDLDYFKQINDQHGHQYGDEYLKRMADALRASVREHVDHACRMGGDEFAIVVFAPINIAERIAEKILQKMQNKVSIGIAELQPDEQPAHLVSRADAALYEAKHLGRGRFVTWQPALSLPKQTSA